jgi:hypothetical protein
MSNSLLCHSRGGQIYLPIGQPLNKNDTAGGWAQKKVVFLRL